jgi:hypothetical protein
VQLLLENPLKPKSVLKIFECSVLTWKKKQPITITKISWLILFKEIIAIYPEKQINTLCGQNTKLLIVEAGGTYSYHWALKG